MKGLKDWFLGLELHARIFVVGAVLLVVLAVFARGADAQGTTGWPKLLDEQETFFVAGLPCPMKQPQFIMWRINKSDQEAMLKEMRVIESFVSTYPSSKEQQALRVEAWLHSMRDLGFGEPATRYVVECWLDPNMAS